MTFGWPVWLAALAALAAGLPPMGADAGLRDRAQPAAARPGAPGPSRPPKHVRPVREGRAERSP